MTQPRTIIPVLVPLAGKSQLVSEPTVLRSCRITEFLQARALAPSSQKAYRYDLKVFTEWADVPWEAVTPRQIAQFKHYLQREADGARVFSDATVCRILGTLKNFYGWLHRTGYVSHNPTAEVALPKLAEPEALNLAATQVTAIFDALQTTSLPERNLALFALLAHGLRPSEPCGLNVCDFDGQRVHIRQAKADSKGKVPLKPWAIASLQAYLGWRLLQGETIVPATPLFVSYSNRNPGARITYDTVRKLTAQLCSKVGFEFHAHQFRHTFATEQVLKGVNPYHVQTLTRHRDQRSFRRYTKAADYAAAEQSFLEAPD